VIIPLIVILKQLFLGWRSNYEGRLESSWTGDSAPLLCRGRRNSIRVRHCRPSTNFSNCPRITLKYKFNKYNVLQNKISFPKCTEP
jgi:hypothetical protein